MLEKKLPRKFLKEPGILEQLLQACRELNPKAEEWLLTECAMWLDISSSSGRLNERPNLQQKGGTRAKDQMVKLAGDLAKVRKNLDKMNIEGRTALQNVQVSKAEAKRQANIGKTHPALYWEAPDLTKMEWYIEEYIRLARDAFDMLEDAPAPKGANRKRQPEAVTKMVAHVYKTLTGIKPTLTGIDDPSIHAQGPFFHFLTHVFHTLRMTDSPENQARNLLYPTRKN